ncbi:MAG: ISAs1 family transposase [Caldilineales bacterium]|nr:ISAs1 family transposase [Caldilineales bacterium]
MAQVQPLREVLAEVPDPRNRGGKRHDLEAILLLMCVAMLCGCKNPNQIATWGASQSRDYLQLLGFKRGSSIRKSALYEVISRIDAKDLEARLMSWVESVVAEMEAADVMISAASAEDGEKSPVAAVALDGKTLRGSKKQGADLSHLLSAVDHKTGMTLIQVPVDGKTNEIPLTQVLLERIRLEGRVFTADVLLTQRAIAEAIVKKGGATSCL